MLASKMMGGQRLGLCSCFLRLPISTYQSSSLLRPWSKPALSAINGSGGNKPLFVQRIMIRNRSLTTGSSQQQSSSSSASSSPLTFFQRFLGPKPMPPRNTLGWYKEVTLICTVFAITGTSTMMVSIINALFRLQQVVVQAAVVPYYDSSNSNDYFLWLSSLYVARSPSSTGYSRLARKHERWTLVVSNLLDHNHVSNLRCLVGVCGYLVWSSRLLSTLFRQNV